MDLEWQLEARIWGGLCLNENALKLFVRDLGCQYVQGKVKVSLLNVAGGNTAFQKQLKPQDEVSGSSGEKLDESSKFLERKSGQRGCHWHLEMLAFILKTFTLEGKNILLSKDKAL